MEKRAATYLIFGVLTLAGALGIIFGKGLVIVAAAARRRVCRLRRPYPHARARRRCSSEPEDVPRMAAGMFTISYSCAVIVPIVSGLVWDATGVPATGFVPIAVAAAPHHRLRPDAAAP